MTEGEWIGDRWSMMLSLKKNLRRNEENVSLSFSIRRRKKRPREREDEEKQKLSSLLETNQLDFFLLSLSLSCALVFLHSVYCPSPPRSSSRREKGRAHDSIHRTEKNFRFRYCPLSFFIFFFFFFRSIAINIRSTHSFSRRRRHRKPVSFHAVDISVLTRSSRRCRSNVVSCRYHSSHLDSAT